MDLLKEKIKAEALRLGFSFIGFSKPHQTPHFPQYKTWRQGSNPEELGYLSKMYVMDARKQPSILLKNAHSVITLGITYPKQKDLYVLDNPGRKNIGQIAAYACLPDYHHWLKDRSRELISFIKRIKSPSINYRFFVDSGPVMEKDFAYLSGLGWIGTNSLFISPVFGSFCLLGCLFVDIELQPDQPDETDVCGDCAICIKSCPTSAITENRTIKASQCISFLTTNYKGEIPVEQCEKIGNNVFGCDICQKVCPLNIKDSKFNLLQSNVLRPIIGNKIDLESELFFSEEMFLAKYSKTPVAKLPFELFLRNLIIAIGNSGNKDLIVPLTKVFQDHPIPIIKAATAWAITSQGSKETQ